MSGFCMVETIELGIESGSMGPLELEFCLGVVGQEFSLLLLDSMPIPTLDDPLCGVVGKLC